MEAREEYEESGLCFRFPPGSVFKPDAVPGKGLQGVKGCDFIWQKGEERLFLVEVKSSAPKRGADLDSYLGEIRVKFTHSLLLWLAALGGRHEQRVMLPADLADEPGLRRVPMPILVVSRQLGNGVIGLQDAVRKEVSPLCRAFDMHQPVVMDVEKARRWFDLRQPGIPGGDGVPEV
jgi:hypothetical protein